MQEATGKVEITLGEEVVEAEVLGQTETGLLERPLGLPTTEEPEVLGEQAMPPPKDAEAVGEEEDWLEMEA